MKQILVLVSICVALGGYAQDAQVNSSVIGGVLTNTKTGLGIPYYFIEIKTADYSRTFEIETDSLGHFTFTVPEEERKRAIIVEIEADPFEYYSSVVKPGKYSTAMKINLTRAYISNYNNEYRPYYRTGSVEY